MADRLLECWVGLVTTEKRRMEQQRFMDQIDADRAAIAWLEKQPGIEQIRWHNHEYPGRTGSAWSAGKLVAMTTVLRDDMNYSVLICHELTPNEKGKGLAN